MKLRIWWIPSLPMKDRFTVEVPDLKTAKLILDTLVDYDNFQYEHELKGVEANCGGLQRWDEKKGEWLDWEDKETGLTFEEYWEAMLS